MLDGAVVDEEPIKHSDVLVEDPEEIHCGLKVRLNFFKSNAKNELGP